MKQVQADAYTASDFGAFSFMAKGGSCSAPSSWMTKLPGRGEGFNFPEGRQRSSPAIFRVNVDENTPPSNWQPDTEGNS